MRSRKSRYQASRWPTVVGATARAAACKTALLSLFTIVCMIASAPAATSAVQSAVVDFLTHVDYATGTMPIDVAIADLNGDGNPDLVVANDGSSTVSVLLGDGAGGFAPRSDFAIGDGPHSVAVADLNGDGKLDLVVSNYVSNTVSVLLNDGHGGFATRTDFTTGPSPFSVAIGDMNGDGRPDLAVANYAGPSVSVMLNDGLGGFANKANFATGSTPASIVVGDFNGDNKLDVAVAEQTVAMVGVLLGNGNGGLGATREFPVGVDAWSVGASDLNKDGKLDLVVANFTSGTISVLMGHGDGTFAARNDFASGDTPRALSIADINGDGFPDVAVPNDGPGTVSVLLGDGTGSLLPRSTYSVGLGPYAVTIGDVNHDGLPDLAAANLASTTVSVLLQVLPRPATTLTLVPAPNPAAFGDAVTLTATILPSAATGIVTFMEGANTLGTGTLNAGIATLQLTGLTAGVHSLSASYGGDAHYAASASAVVDETVDPAATTTTIQSSVSTAPLTQPVTFVATVSTVRSGLPTPDGAIQFKVDGSNLGSPVPLSSGTASTGPVTTLPLGSHTVLASYPASGNFAASQSAPITFVVTSGDPTIVAVRDVPNDQGGHVFLTWDSPLDAPGLRVVTGYRIWRRAPNPLAMAPATAAVGVAHVAAGLAQPAAASPSLPHFNADPTAITTNDGYWEAIASLPAEQLVHYAFEAPTTQDSMPDLNPYSAYFVTALTADPFVYFQSAADSGYSVDNLAPPMPAPFAATFTPGSATLHWGTSPVADFREFRLYRGISPQFVPGPNNLVIATRDTGFVDVAQGTYVYKLTALDVHGNLSRYAVVSPDMPVATLASLVNVTAQADRIQLLWYAAGGPGTAATVYRRSATTSWASLGQILADGLGYLRYEDATVQVGTTYGYRLGIMDGGAELYAGETWATAQPSALVLDGARPNPALGGVVVISFTLPVAAPASLELIDVSGRRAASIDVGSLGPGRHTWTFGRDAGIPPAIYHVRLTQGGRSMTRRVAVLR